VRGLSSRAMGEQFEGTLRALRQTADHAADFCEALNARRVGLTAGIQELREVLGRPLPDEPMHASRVIAELVRDAEAGLLGSAGGRFFSWVVGGSGPAALAADWLTSAWNQSAALYACAPAEEVCEVWLKDLLGLPAHASFALVNGTQMGHATALPAARNKLLVERGWDVERRGVAGAPPIQIITGGQQHASIDRAVRLLGLGTDAIVNAEADPDAPCVSQWSTPAPTATTSSEPSPPCATSSRRPDHEPALSPKVGQTPKPDPVSPDADTRRSSGRSS
jgi:hypothetical protein